MKLIESNVQIIEEKDPYKMIELAGRTCYKSEDKITEDSAKEFVDRMIKLGHGAMLEHGTIYLKIQEINGHIPPAMLYWRDSTNQKYSKVRTRLESDSPYSANYEVLYVTTNLRVLVENNRLADLQYQVKPTEYHEKRITAKFICDRGVSHEFVRHRVFSFAQESQRYCNYSKDKFNNEITFIMPSWWNYNSSIIESGERYFCEILQKCEDYYKSLLDMGYKPQEARVVLPNATKTELVMTGFESDWEHFFELRCSKAAHPDAQKLANELKELLTNVKNN
ncbi:MAG: FAD-dependent thymidylate synthase [Romboutsia timonensis]